MNAVQIWKRTSLEWRHIIKRVFFFFEYGKANKIFLLFYLSVFYLFTLFIVIDYNGYQVFPGDKGAGAWLWPPTPSSADVKESVGLYIFSPSGPSWPVLVWTLLLLSFIAFIYCSKIGKLTPQEKAKCMWRGSFRTHQTFRGKVILERNTRG
jgi:hypothetical protein